MSTREIFNKVQKQRKSQIHKSYLSELLHDLDLMGSLEAIPEDIPRPKYIKKAFKVIEPLFPVIDLTKNILGNSNQTPVSYVLHDREAFYKLLPHMTIKEVNSHAYGLLSKFPDALMVLNYTRWTEEGISEPAIMILATVQSDLVWCLNWYRMKGVKEDMTHWIPASEPVVISMGLPFSSRMDKEDWAKRCFGNPKALDNYHENILPMGDSQCDGDAIAEVYTFLGCFLYAVNSKGTKFRKVEKNGDTYKVLVYKDIVC